MSQRELPRFPDLRSFLSHLEGKGDLISSRIPANIHLEASALHRRLIADGGPALLLRNPVRPDGSRVEMPLLINLFGNRQRVAEGLGVAPDSLERLGEFLAALRSPRPPRNMADVKELYPMAKAGLAARPKIVRPGRKLEEVSPDLSRLPVQTCWPGDAGPLITWPVVITRPPGKDDPRDYNLGIYRMQVTGPKSTYMRWLKHRGGAQHHARWKAKRPEPLPAAAVIGADPGTIIAAVTPVPDNLSEYQFAGLLRGKRLELVDCKTVPLKVPASAEIVIEGHVSLDEYGDEGPYGDHTGYYNSVEQFPVFRVSAITMRRDPIYLSTFTGRPPDEPSVLGEALNDVLVPLLCQAFPEITDFYLPPEGCSYRIAVVSMRKAYPGHAKRVMMGVWSYLRQFIYTKWVIVVDDDIDARDWKDVMWAVSTRMDPARDITLVENTPIDYLDFASPVSGLGSKIGLDATNKITPETNREWGRQIRMEEEVVEKVSAMWNDLGLPGSGKPIWK